MTRRFDCDVAILGAGFGGSLLAQIAQKVGRRVVLLERGRHPRFAIGESSTPLANLKLATLADRYGLDQLKPLSDYGPWKRTYPDITCGLKRGFSFFHHQHGQPFESRADHSNELLVTANPDEERGDTHWLRADVDHFFVKQAVDAGVCYIDSFELTDTEHADGWVLSGDCDVGRVEVRAPFVVDATGHATALAGVFDLRKDAPDLRTRSRALYGHFTNVGLWADVLAEHPDGLAHHPYPCDAAALHHVFDGGWMWVLRFDNGVTSAGFSLDMERHPLDGAVTPADEWRTLLEQFPSIARQFAHAKPVRPLVRTDRLQRRLSAAAGHDWAVLPYAAGFVDPWLSTGIAQTMHGVERLSRVLADAWDSPDRGSLLADYDRAVFRGMDLVDRITAACFKSFDHFDLMVHLSMIYFTAAIYAEERIRAGQALPDDEFLLTHDDRFRAITEELCTAAAQGGHASADAFGELARARLVPYNTCGMCDPDRQNMYPFTGSL